MELVLENLKTAIAETPASIAEVEKMIAANARDPEKKNPPERD